MEGVTTGGRNYWRARAAVHQSRRPSGTPPSGTPPISSAVHQLRTPHLVLDAKLAYDLAAGVANGAMEEFIETGRKLPRQHIEVLQHADDARELRPLRAVFHLDGNPQSARGNGDRMDSLGADLRDHGPLGLFDEDRIEAIGAAYEKGSGLHRVYDAPADLVVLARGARKVGVRPSHVIEREREHHRAAAVDGPTDGGLRKPRPFGHCLETTPLDRMLLALVAKGWPVRRVRARQHRGVLARAIVVETGRPRTRLPQNTNPACGERFVRSTREVTFLHPDVAQHRLGEDNVLGLTAMRGAGERELIVSPPKRVEPSRLQEWHDLKRLCAGAPRRHIGGVARSGNEDAVLVDDGGVHAVPGLDDSAAGDDDVQLDRLHRGW